jgi:3-deoxy-7-phosphoheptulonate synthase
MTKWSVNSWRNFAAKHLPEYPDAEKLKRTEEQLKTYPPLVFAGEARELKRNLAKVSEGKAFLLQGGDCAESFEDFNADYIRDTFKVLLQMSVTLTAAGNCPVVKVGRMAGQFAKPRSAPKEEIDGIELDSYKGDIINDMDFTEDARVPDPERMIRAYTQSASTLNLLRAFAKGGFADLNKVHQWNMGFVDDSPQGQKYREIANKISDTLAFMKAIGISSQTTRRLRSVDFYTSHEALLLPYEECLTRTDSTSGEMYDTSAHMVWIGDRTRQLDGAHVEFCRGIKNPIGIKCGPTLSPDELKKLIGIINPENEAGKITLICRFGAENVKESLPKLIKPFINSDYNLVWSCDPMHGNTTKSNSGFKTRPFERVFNEVESFFDIHHNMGTYPGGVHLEMTGQNVTECIGGAQAIKDEDLSARYHTHCDPRLNASQAIELAFLISDKLRESQEPSNPKITIAK